jgi:hypothetical protein
MPVFTTVSEPRDTAGSATLILDTSPGCLLGGSEREGRLLEERAILRQAAVCRCPQLNLS